jgi:hypothetical protein
MVEISGPVSLMFLRTCSSWEPTGPAVHQGFQEDEPVQSAQIGSDIELVVGNVLGLGVDVELLLGGMLEFQFLPGKRLDQVCLVSPYGRLNSHKWDDNGRCHPIGWGEIARRV